MKIVIERRILSAAFLVWRLAVLAALYAIRDFCGKFKGNV
jgi:hypothetical protein